MSDERKLRAVLQGVYDFKHSEVEVSPSAIAAVAMRQIDPDNKSPDLCRMAAELQLRQLARSICRGRPGSEDEDEQQELFKGLQKRYPLANSKDGDPIYVLLEQLPEADKTYNVNRLRKEAGAKSKHADALEAYWKQNHPTI